MKSKAAPEDNGPVSQETSGICGITMEEIRRIISGALGKYFDELEKNLDRISDITNMLLRATAQRLAGAEHDARQSCLATESDVKPDTKTCKRAEDAESDQAKNGDSCSAKTVDAGRTNSTSFGMTVEPPALPRRDDVLVDKGAEAPKPHLPPVEVRMLPSAAGGLLPAGTALTAMSTTFPRPFFS